MSKFLKAVKTARNMVNNTKSDLETALEKAASLLSAAGQTTAQDLIQRLGKEHTSLKELLADKDPQIEVLKTRLKATANLIRDAKCTSNKLEGMGDDNASSSSKRRK